MDNAHRHQRRNSPGPRVPACQTLGCDAHRPIGSGMQTHGLCIGSEHATDVGVVRMLSSSLVGPAWKAISSAAESSCDGRSLKLPRSAFQSLEYSRRVGPTVSAGFDSFCAFAAPNVKWQCSRGPRVEVLCPRTQCSGDRWRKVGCAVLGGADTGSGPPDRRNVARASGKHKHCLYCCLPYLTHASTSKTARAVKTGCRL